MPIRIEFEELGDCIEFIDLALRNEPRLKFQRNDIQIDVLDADENRGSFAVTIPGVSAANERFLLRLARCEGFSGEGNRSQGEQLGLRQLLERVKLAVQPTPPSGHPLALLLFRGNDDDFRREYTELVDMGCHGLRVGLVHPSEQNQYLSHMILVESPPATFWPPQPWLQGAGTGSCALACYRLRPDADCRMYVQWGFEHPVARLEFLYDMRMGGYDRIFAMRGTADGETVKPQWIRVREEDSDGIFELSSQRLTLQMSAPLSSVDLQPNRSDRGVSLDLRVEREHRGTSCSLQALETQIAHHQQAIEELQRDYRIAHALRQQAIYLAYIFRQDLERDDDRPPRLSATLARFLDQPFNQLKEMQYAFYEFTDHDSKQQGMHIVFDLRPEVHGRLLTSLADEVYVQREEWEKEKLPLFVRHGDDLRPRLDDKAFAEKLREQLWQGRSPEEETVLLRSVPEERAANGAASWTAMYVQTGLALTDSDCFAFLNQRFSCHLLDFRSSIQDELDQCVQAASVSVSDRCRQLEGQILEAVQQRIDVGEEKWRTVDEKIETVVKKTRDYENTVNDAEAALTGFQSSWTSFFEQVLTATRNLYRPRLQAAEAYEETQEKLVEAAEIHKNAVQDIHRQVDQDISAVRQRQADYEGIEREAERLVGELTEYVAEFAGIRDLAERNLEEKKDEVSAQKEQVATALRDIDTELQRVKTDLRIVTQQQADLRRRRTESRRLEAESTAKKKQLETDMQRLEEDNRKLETVRGENLQMQEQVTALRENHEREHKSVRGQHETLNDQLRQQHIELEKLRMEKKLLDTDVAKIENQGGLLNKQRKEYQQKQQELEETMRKTRELEAKCKEDEEQWAMKLAELETERSRVTALEAELRSKKQEHDANMESCRQRKDSLAAELNESHRKLRAALEPLDRQLENLGQRETALQSLLKQVETLTTWLDQRESQPAAADREDVLMARIRDREAAAVLKDLKHGVEQAPRREGS